MVKNISLIGTLLASTAVATAQPAPQSYAITLTVKVAGDTRVHELVLVEGCGSVVRRTPNNSDEIRVCLRNDKQVGLIVETSWETHVGANSEYKATGSTIMARGQQFEIGTADARFVLRLK